MHIALVNQWFPPESGWGGVALYNWVMAHAYRTLGHAVSVIAARSDPTMPVRDERDGICIQRLLVRDPYYLRRLPGIGYYVRPLQQLIYSARVNQALRELQVRQPVDVVEFAEVNAEGFFYARSPQAPVVVRCHTPTFVLARYYTAREMPYDKSIIGWCERDLIRRAHALTAPSGDMARVIAGECHIPLNDIAVIPNALSSNEWRVTSDEKSDKWQVTGAPDYPTTRPPDHVTILHVGRLDRVKGVGVLAAAIPRVLGQFPAARFIFVGADRPTARGKSQWGELRAQLAAAGTHTQVEFLGEVEQRALQEWYHRADICVVPSLLYESFSYTCAQAMAAGKPVVASRIAGIPETVADGETGLLVKPGDVVELADALVRLAREPALRARLGRAGRDKVTREFEPLKLAQRNLEIYASARTRFGKGTGSLTG